MRSTGSEEEPLDVELVGDDDFALSARDDAGLSARDRKILAFERRWWRYAGAKEQAIRENFGVSATRYYQLLGELIDRSEAMAHDPMLIKRLRRLRATRRRDRAARRFGTGSGTGTAL